MLNITDRALDILEQELHASRNSDGQMLRIADVGGQMSLTIDEQQPGDEVISRHESPVLAVSEDTAGRLDGLTLDLDEDDEGARLVFREGQISG